MLVSRNVVSVSDISAVNLMVGRWLFACSMNCVERTRVPKNAILVSMDVTSLYTNIPQEEGIETVCKAYDAFYKEETPIATEYIKRALKLILQENSFEFNGKNYLQTHGTAMGTKMAVAFANIFMGTVESQILRRSALKPLVWKRFIDDIFSIWNINKDGLWILSPSICFFI